ncbi:D-alanyl-D-alanine carboxypeptidase family protein [Alkalibacter mobilis]|uniref:D-alanyl-D-alanine carboxypeptidase family protein n=1 Tax=Alkalibacter mobilis TaxID=2787712 RepID=UPI00189FA0BB|nr:D-alanyl-D-alanine carboxypeptidase family protein [Alkalibacter mobilis]MBF7096564.1 D-alanyl-D-alanine carboxypeptidase [Alkalibacter mobilis]
MIKKILLNILLYMLIFGSTPIFAQPSIEAPTGILMDGTTGQILYEKNCDETFYPASTTKILTALLFMENVAMDEILTVNEDVPNLIEQGSSQIYLIPGEQLTGEQLLNALMIESANDAAVVIAQHISGNVEEFGKLMTKRAKELGAVNSNFTNPNGLHDDNHYTTAKDMALILQKVIKYPALTEIMTRRNYVIPETAYQDTRYLWTKNKLLQSSQNNFYNENVIASKTGYTTKAGNALVTAAKKDDLTLITVVLNCIGTMTYNDTNAMLEFGFNGFKRIELLNNNQLLKTIQIGKDNLDLISSQEFSYTIPKNESETIESEIFLPDEISLPLEKGESVGKIVYTFNGSEIGAVDLLAATAISKPFSFLGILKTIFLIFILFLFIIYIGLRLYVERKNRIIRQRKALRNRKTRNEYSKF